MGKPKGAGRSSFDLIDAHRVLRELNLQEGKVVLDIGCGYGAYSLAVASQCPRCKIVALDLWQEGVKRLKSDLVEKNLKWVMPVIGDAGRAIPLKDGSTDVCLTATVLHDLAEEGKHEYALREIRRVLRKGGLFCVIEFKKISGTPGPPLDIRLSPDELEMMVVPHGFQLAKSLDVGRYNYLSLFK